MGAQVEANCATVDELHGDLTLQRLAPLLPRQHRLKVEMLRRLIRSIGLRRWAAKCLHTTRPTQSWWNDEIRPPQKAEPGGEGGGG